jgi:hypothetical protein
VLVHGGKSASQGLLYFFPRLPPACLSATSPHPACPAECRFEEALGCLEQCSPATFQPSQLFPLFPSYTAAWAQQVSSSRVCFLLGAYLAGRVTSLLSRRAGITTSSVPHCIPQPAIACLCCLVQVPSHQQYWGLHAALPSLETLISQKLATGRRRHAHQRQEGGSSSSGQPSPLGSLGSSLFALEGSSGGGESPTTASPPTAAAAAGSGEQRAPQNGSLQPPAASEAQQQERQELQRRAWQSLAQYLFRVSSQAGRQAGRQAGLCRQRPALEVIYFASGPPCLVSSPQVQRPCSPSLSVPLLQVRMLEGVACLPGVDTMLLLLLADLGDARQVAAFAAVPNEVEVAAVEPRLKVRACPSVCNALF